MVTGRTFSFEEAQELGIVTDIYEGDSAAFQSQVLTYAKQFTTPNKAAKAVGNIKRSVQSGSEVPFSEALAIERELQQLLFQSSDAKEGLTAYVDKRMAKFENK
jgi:enoyl-CoA hydratase/carnithine racemase